MSHIASPQIDEENLVAQRPVAKPELRGDIEGLGKFLFQMRSIHYVPILFFQEETTLQFYEHVVVANIARKLWCFPKSMNTTVIPRFKIVNATFTYGPRSMPWLVYFLVLIGLILVLTGMIFGGCQRISYYGYTYYNSSTCSMAVIGFLVLFILVPIVVFIPCCFKKHHVYFDVNAYSFLGCCCKIRTITYEYRFKIIGFETAASNKAAFDEFYLMNYVYETLGKHGIDAMDNYHLLSHFQHSDLARPIQPMHADDSIRDTLALAKQPKVVKSSPSVPNSSNGHTRKRHQPQLQTVAV